MRGQQIQYTPFTNDRQAELRQMLETRRKEIVADLQERVRQIRARAASSDAMDVVDAAESAEADIQDELRFSLIQMKSEMLERIDDALIRLGSGNFGVCVSCGDEISERRLHALPFALRCTECEQEREMAARAAQLPQRRYPGSLFDMH